MVRQLGVRAGMADLEAPRAILELAGDRSFCAVWVNEVGGVTFRLGEGSETEFVKWTPKSTGINPYFDETERLLWAARFVTVPRVLGSGYDEEGSFLTLSSIDGENAVSDRWVSEPARAVSAIGKGLRHLHDALPVDGCPFSWPADVRLARARQLYADGDLWPAAWHQSHHGLTAELALEALAVPPAVDKLVVCHGDACAPNTSTPRDLFELAQRSSPGRAAGSATKRK